MMALQNQKYFYCICHSKIAIDSFQLLYHAALSFHQRYHIIILQLHFQVFKLRYLFCI